MIETTRCRLSILQECDYEDVKKLYLDEKVRRFLGGTVNEQTYKKKFLDMYEANDDSLYWVIRHKVSNEIIGLVSLDLHHDGISTEVSYQLLPKWWGCGYATEVVRKVIEYAFKHLGLSKVIAETQTANKLSCKMLERIGMSLIETVERFGVEQSIYVIENPLD